mmetsp:Transcript_6669/g.14604  ORF Transcript_6669/g.14604 Transcript_6669/m.14604 type:complete len:209 (+) Transcript_6669:105-731(+)|eukprot:CAMPEP_0173188722 /NCGR_PEP_ID=MMETSP1141-20130122/11402_1 /TAXON_ID=483371 /ORGANISM="non described non described, Strain CCMP2298" /LENGTH=208 /DNA_ID=CAMNT_0014112661 /DNA_START=21 /DNA_END=647 /DNA_ORIENTATION=+
MSVYSDVSGDTAGENPPPLASQYQLKPIYLNIMLLNKNEVVKSKVTAKTGTGLFARAAGKALASTANRLVSSVMVMGAITEKVITNVEAAVALMGIKATLEKVFQQDAFVVVRVQVVEVDKLMLLRGAKGEEFAANFESLLTSLHHLGLDGDTIVDKKIKDHIQDALMCKFAMLIPLKLQEQGVAVSLQVVTSEQQAESFFRTLKNMA